MAEVPTIFEAAHCIGAVPILVLGALRLGGRPVPSAWWLMALAFGVSFVADTAVDLGMSPLVISQTYPVTQAALFLLILLPQAEAVAVIGGLLAVAAGSLWDPLLGLRQGEGLDFPLHAVAWGSIAAAAWHVLRPGWLRAALGMGFAALVVAWAGYVAVPGWWTWGGFQMVRAMQAAAFAVAAWQGTSRRGV